MRDVRGSQVERIRRRRFERLVARALRDLPEGIHLMLDNVAVVVEDEPSPEHLAESDGDTLFGLYQGVPLTERGSGYSMVLPDKITIFRRPIEDACSTPREIEDEVRITVVHELAHHLGIDEDRLEELGWQ
jgi:predicted Zn-dependent protease with MMP-like domain